MILSNGSVSHSSQSLGVLRFGAGMVRDLAVGCADPVFFGIHWDGKRQLLCAGEICPICGGDGARQTGFLLVESQAQHDYGRQLLIGVSFPGIVRAQEFCLEQHMKWAPGLVITVSRRKKNSPLMIKPKEVRPVQVCQATTMTIIGAAATLFGVPTPAAHETPETWSARIQPAAARLLT